MNVSSGQVKSGRPTVFAVAVILVIVFVGCGGSGENAVMRSAYVEFTPEQKMEIESGTPSEYRIQRGDILTIAFPYENNLSQNSVLVLNDGAVGLIGVDRVVLAGLTMTEADSVITDAYSREYREPELSVIMFESKGQRVYVLGEVNQPGMYDVPPDGLGIVGAVTMAGGFHENAAKEGTVLVRVTPDGYLVQEIDLSDIGNIASASLAMVNLRPYDVVYVPRSRSGDFAVFSRQILVGLANITRIAVDIYFLSGGAIQRF